MHTRFTRYLFVFGLLASLGDQDMEMGMEIDAVTKCLDDVITAGREIFVFTNFCNLSSCRVFIIILEITLIRIKGNNTSYF